MIKRKERVVPVGDIEHRKVSDIPEGTQKPTVSKRGKENIKPSHT
jgi:hypothetical protein